MPAIQVTVPSDEIVSTNIFFDSWNTIKSYISDILAVGPSINESRAQWNDLRLRAIAAGDKDTLINVITPNLLALNDMSTTYNSVKSYIDKWWSSWVEAETPSSGFGSLGFIPILVFGVAGIAAAAYVATNGMELLKNYEIQKQVLSDVENKIITAEQAKGIISSANVPTSSSALMTSLGGSIGTYVGIGIAALGIIYLWPIIFRDKKGI